jgi:hypothetical protein
VGAFAPTTTKEKIMPIAATILTMDKVTNLSTLLADLGDENHPVNSPQFFAVDDDGGQCVYLARDVFAWVVQSN